MFLNFCVLFCSNRKEPRLLKLQERSTLTLRKALLWLRWWSTLTSKRRAVKVLLRCVFLYSLIVNLKWRTVEFVPVTALIPWETSLIPILNVFSLISLPLSQAAGKYRQQGRNYIVEDGDIIFFKFNTPNAPKKKPWDHTITRGTTHNTV